MYDLIVALNTFIQKTFYENFICESYISSGELCRFRVVCSVLARELQNRGHETAVFIAILTLRQMSFISVESRFEDIQTFKINNTYRVQRFQEIYLNPVIAAKFSLLLRQWKPEVVHFHHLTNLALTGAEAKSFGSAVVMTLHDYWLLCQRGMLKRDLEPVMVPATVPAGPARTPVTQGQNAGGRFADTESEAFALSEETGIDLLDLRRAQVNTSNPDFVGITSLLRTILPIPCCSCTLGRVHYPIQLKQNGILKTAIAMHPSTTDKPGVEYALKCAE